MRIRLIAFTRRGLCLGRRCADILAQNGDEASLLACFGDKKQDLAGWTKSAFAEADALIFIGAAGIAVRAVAPHVSSKLSDPAVIVIDEGARFVIPMLSGHIGGANALAARLASQLPAVLAVTTATDVNGLFAADSWAAAQGLFIKNPGLIKTVSAKLLGGAELLIKSDFDISGAPPAGIRLVSGGECDIFISVKNAAPEGALHLIPPCCAVGVGCRRGTSAEVIESAFLKLLEQNKLAPESVFGIFTIDLKSDEPGLLRFCGARGLPLKAFSAAELGAVPGEFTPSDFVLGVTGTDNVCERSAVLGCGGGLTVKKTVLGAVTMAVATAEPQLDFEGGVNNG